MLEEGPADPVVGGLDQPCIVPHRRTGGGRGGASECEDQL